MTINGNHALAPLQKYTHTRIVTEQENQYFSRMSHFRRASHATGGNISETSQNTVFLMIQKGHPLASYLAVDGEATASCLDVYTSISALEYAIIYDRSDAILYLQTLEDAKHAPFDAQSIAVSSSVRSERLHEGMSRAQAAVRSAHKNTGSAIITDELRSRWYAWEHIVRQWYQTLESTTGDVRPPECHVQIFGDDSIGIHLVGIPAGTTYVQLEWWAGHASERTKSYTECIATNRIASRIIPCGISRHTITNLDLGQTYHVQIRGYNPHGFGEAVPANPPCVHLAVERLRGVRSKEVAAFENIVINAQSQGNGLSASRMEVKKIKVKLKKNLRKGLYVSALLSRPAPGDSHPQSDPADGDREYAHTFDGSRTQVLVHSAAYLPTVPVAYTSNDFVAECTRDADWITRCCVDWHALPTFPGTPTHAGASKGVSMADVSDTPTLQLRRAIVAALAGLNSLVGKKDLGPYWGTPLVVQRNRATVLLFGRRFSDLPRAPRGMSWVDYGKVRT